jgi:hypothetical protein
MPGACTHSVESLCVAYDSCRLGGVMSWLAPGYAMTPRASPWVILCRPFRAGGTPRPTPASFHAGCGHPLRGISECGVRFMPTRWCHVMARPGLCHDSQGVALGYPMPPLQGWGNAPSHPSVIPCRVRAPVAWNLRVWRMIHAAPMVSCHGSPRAMP